MAGQGWGNGRESLVSQLQQKLENNSVKSGTDSERGEQTTWVTWRVWSKMFSNPRERKGGEMEGGGAGCCGSYTVGVWCVRACGYREWSLHNFQKESACFSSRRAQRSDCSDFP